MDCMFKKSNVLDSKGGPHTLLQADEGEPGEHYSEISSLPFPSGLRSAS